MKDIAEHPYMVLAQRIVSAIILGVASYACTMIVSDHDGIADIRARLGIIEEKVTAATVDRYTASDATRDQRAQAIVNDYLEKTVSNHEARIERAEDHR